MIAHAMPVQLQLPARRLKPTLLRSHCDCGNPVERGLAGLPMFKLSGEAICRRCAMLDAYHFGRERRLVRETVGRSVGDDSLGVHAQRRMSPWVEGGGYHVGVLT